MWTWKITIDDDAEDELEFLPRLQVFVRPQEEKASGSHEREEEGVGSQEREETQPQQDEAFARKNQEQHEDEILWLMMSALSDASFSTFMDQYAPMMGYEISYDTYHEFKLGIDKVLKDNEHLGAENFLGAEDPDLVDDDPNTPLPDLQGQSAGDPEYKHTIEKFEH